MHTTTTFRDFVPPPKAANAARDYSQEFKKLCTLVNAVNHGEFEGTVDTLIEQAAIDESSSDIRAKPVAIQRCRRGGKTFMLHAVASMLAGKTGKGLPADTHIIFISLNSTTPYSPDVEDKEGTGALFSIRSRIAWELSNRQHSFVNFRDNYDGFGTMDDWLQDRRVVLIVDELNITPHTAERYTDMSSFLDNIVQRDGCAVLYSTHQRSTVDLLRGRRPGTPGSIDLSKRQHLWRHIPRIVTEDCLHGLSKNTATEASFWSAVLRGRIPALVRQNSQEIEDYTDGVFLDKDDTEERIRCLKAGITGDVENLTNERNTFRAYSYMSERFKRGQKAKFAWPPFMVAQINVLGKEYTQLYETLQNPCIDEAKAFEALTQLAVLVRLLTQMEHDLVPMNVAGICNAGVTAFEATELLFVRSNATSIPQIVDAASNRFSLQREVQQVVAIPLFASFPVYDFFVLHRTERGWRVAAGYQCKQGSKLPKEEADKAVSMSVWLEGRCRKYRVGGSDDRLERKEEKGWILLSENCQSDLLGVTVSEAVPADPACEDSETCDAEKTCRHRRDSGAAERSGLTRASESPPKKRPRAKT